MRIPERITLKHYDAVAYLGANNGDLTYDKIEVFLIKFYGFQHRKEIKSGDYKSILSLFNKVVIAIDVAIKDKNKAPDKVIELDGKDFKLVDMLKPTIGWMIDASSVDHRTPPYAKCALGYIPKDSYYGEVDEHDNLLYPSTALKEVFENHMLLVDFLKLNAFFLKQSQLLLLRYRTEIKVMKMMKFWKKTFLKMRKKRKG